MILNMYSVYDRKAGAYMRPFFEHTDGMAVRAFQDACREPKSSFYNFPEDFSLWCIGGFDDQEAQLTAVKPIQLATAVQLRPQTVETEETLFNG